MKYATIVFELEDDKKPPFNFSDEVDGGRVVTISLDNAMARLDLIEQAIENRVQKLEVVIGQILEERDIENKQLSDFVEEE